MTTSASVLEKPLFSPGMGGRMWSRVWPALAFYVLSLPAVMVRAIADDIGLPIRRNFSAVEAALLTDAPTHWLQGSLVDVEWTQAAGAAIYFTWFFVPITTALGVLMFRPQDYWRFIAFLLLLYYAVMPFFILYPLEAPWAQDAGIHRFIGERFAEAAAQDPNPYAAMPSLHIALPAAAALWYGLGSLWGRVVLAYSALIGVVVIFSGEHYAADVAAGYAVAAATYVAARRLRLPVFAPSHEHRAPARIAGLGDSRRLAA
jgi:hypothetical protein